MFMAKLIDMTGFQHAFPGLTYGKQYEVVDFNDWSGTYTIVDDRGRRTTLHWGRFEDRGRASTAYRPKR